MTTTATMTTIKVPAELRDRLREIGAGTQKTLAEVIEDCLWQVEQAAFLDSLANWEPDEEYLAEMREWDNADLAPSLRDYPYEPMPTEGDA